MDVTNTKKWAKNDSRKNAIVTAVRFIHQTSCSALKTYWGTRSVGSQLLLVLVPNVVFVETIIFICVRYAGNMTDPFASPVVSSTLTAATNTQTAINRCAVIAIAFEMPRIKAIDKLHHCVGSNIHRGTGFEEVEIGQQQIVSAGSSTKTFE